MKHRWIPLVSAVVVVAVIGMVPAAGAAGHAPVPHRHAANLNVPGLTVSIMPLGDSYAQGMTADSSNGQNGYRLYLLNDLQGPGELHPPGGPTLAMVGSQQSGTAGLHHEGHPGWTVAQVTAGVQGGWLATYQPNIVILTVGSNDFGAGRDWHLVATDYAALVNLILAAPSVPDVVLTEQVVHSGAVSHVLTQNTREQQAFNAALPAMVATFPAGRVVVAHTARLRQQDLDSGGVHPTDGGYRRMEWEIYRSLAPWLGWPDGSGGSWMTNVWCPYDTCP